MLLVNVQEGHFSNHKVLTVIHIIPYFDCKIVKPVRMTYKNVSEYLIALPDYSSKVFMNILTSITYKSYNTKKTQNIPSSKKPIWITPVVRRVKRL